MKRMRWLLLTMGIVLMAQATSLVPQVSGYDKYVREGNSSNRYEVAGITNAGAFEAFFEKLQEAVKNSDKTEVAKHVRYPLRVNKDGKSQFIRDEQQFLEEYNRIMTEKVKEAFLQQKVTDTFVNDQGVMVGNGEIWLGQFSNRFVVFAINVE
ncbi:hypothetical protein BBR47_21480 [Brevibacillus brevis NBRC 100599]|uniref:Uncharacterized protein n=1 Tax=Brevibacillus brevis (strain 47 / JCM 6285 / NBRC 100599) TaxID=358681 RepID=C0ZBG6_BREBN|nr:hypothetical protein [Brevibacillus brevis]BAH43125.1 hypothetical protein BBR47_21480 [Brevibacillus brevis NBRC 100599]